MREKWQAGRKGRRLMGKDGISGPKAKSGWSLQLRIKGLMYLQNVLITK